MEDYHLSNCSGGIKMRDILSNHSSNTGYTQKEAEAKKAKVDEAHGVGKSNSKWAEAKVEPDPRGGYLVTIETL
jgi:hypothetical protein